MTATASRLTNLDGLRRELADSISISRIAEGLGVELQASGDQYRGLCPLHLESTPSFYVRDGKGPLGVFHCFGCGAEGDGIDLVQQIRHLGFVEALYWLAAEADVEIGNYERPLTDQEQRQEEFRTWCEGWITARAAEPLPMRIRSASQVAVSFGVVERHGATTELSGYFRDKQYLCDGVILPWRTPAGRLVGWRVREHEDQPKHVVGTPNDFPLGRITEETLFGIQVAREYISEGQLVGVEGEYDTLACHAAGFCHVVGLGGSTLTAGQVKLLEGLHVREFTAVFDGDESGRRAAQTFAERYWAHETIFFRVTTCSPDMDPEDELKAFGDWAFANTIHGARSGLEFLLRLAWAQKGRDTLTEKLEFVKWIRDTYGPKLRSTEESLVLAEVAKWLEIPELEVRDYVRAAEGSLCAVDSERMLIGKCCRDRAFYVSLRSRLSRDDFFVLKHQRLWDLLADLLIEGLEFDPVTLGARVAGVGVPDSYLEGCLEASESNLDYHIGVVADLSLRRSSRDDAVSFRDRITDLAQPAELLVGDLTHRITTRALRKTGATQRQLPEQVDEAIETLFERMRNPTEIHGLNLGSQLPQLSRTLQGLQPKRLILVAAVSRVGKSSLLCQLAASLGVHQSLPIDFISLEMDEKEILYKLASHLTGLDSMKISGGRLEPDEAKLVEYAMARIRNSPLRLWTPDGLTATEFLLYARESVMRRRTRAFLVDYVQLIDPEPGQEKDNGYRLYGDFGRMCKMKVARSMDVCVICAAQMRREAAGKERPTAEDLADSYALVRHSDVMIILHGQEDSSTLELYVEKNRQGSGGGLIPTIYHKPTNTFREAQGGLREPDYLVRV